MKLNKSREEREQHWKAIIEDWQSSGKTIKDFCKTNKITVSGFYQWRNRLYPELKKRHRRTRKSNQIQSALVPVQILDTPSQSLRLNLPNGCWVTLPQDFDVVALNKLMQALGGKHVDAS